MYRTIFTSLTVLAALMIGTSCRQVQPKSTLSDDTIYYAAVHDLMGSVIGPNGDSTHPFILEDSVSSGDAYEGLDRCLQDSTFFTPQERHQLQVQAAHPAFRVWTARLVGQVGNVRLIPTDTITSIFSGSLDNGWDYVYKHIGRDINNFGCPLFFRNYTWCLLYSSTECGSLCGSGQLRAYKKEGGHWVLVKEWGLWIS